MLLNFDLSRMLFLRKKMGRWLIILSVVVSQSAYSQSSQLRADAGLSADAGLDQNISLLPSFTLFGSGNGSDGSTLTYQWTQIGTPSVTLSGATTSAVTITGIVAGTFTFRLMVTDALGNSAYDDVIVNASDVPNNYSYTMSNTVLIPNQTTSTQVANLPIGNKLTTSDFKDDLGRSVEQIQVQGSPNGKDMIAFKVFDGLGRETNHYLPYVESQNSGFFIPLSTATVDQKTFYNAAADKIINDASPFGISAFESSPLGRPVQQINSGAYWQTNNITHTVSYGTNAPSDILNWSIDGTSGLPVTSPTFYYTSSVLKKVLSTDEQNVNSETYTDFSGNKILERRDAGGQWAETYYVYDSKNNLRFVLPPELIRALKLQTPQTFTPTPTQIDRWAYQSHYDNLNRLVEFKAPGAGWVYTIYDTRNRVVLTQDANQRNGDAAQLIPANKWSYVKYDEQNRPVASGIYGPDNTKTTRDAMQEYINSMNSGLGYQNVTLNSSIPAFKLGVDIVASSYESINTYAATNSISFEPGFTFTGGVTATELKAQIEGNGSGAPSVIFPIALDEPLTRTYYDNYNCEICTDPNYQFTPTEPWYTASVNEPYVNYTRVKGSTVASSVKVLGTNTWLNTVSYYNRHGQAIQIISANHLGGRDRISSLVDFSGKKLEEIQTSIGYNNGNINTMRKVFAYDPVGRLLTVQHQINTQSMITLSALEYNELGQVVKKKLHSTDGTNFLQKIDYRYNLHGALTNINNIPASNDTGDDSDDYFGLDLTYEGTVSGVGAGNSPRNDGMVSAIRWKQDLGSKKRLYNFKYDNLSRVTSSIQKMSLDNSTTWTGEPDFFSETGITYDLNGNIQALNRNTEYFSGGSNSANSMDQLSYVYGANSNAIDNGNQLQYVSDNSVSATSQLGFKDGGTNSLSDPDYLYNSNGNLWKDQNKGIDSISYYFNNLPKKVKFKDGSFLTYAYDAAGIKLSQAYSFAQGSTKGTVLDSLDFGSTYSPFLSNGTILLSLSNGQLKVGGASQGDNAYVTLPTVKGHKYLVSFSADLGGSGTISALANGMTHNLGEIDITANGSYSYQFIAIGSQTSILFGNAVAGPRDFYLDNVVIKDQTVTTDYVGNIVLLQGQVLTINHSEGRITAPTYSNLFANPNAGSLDGYTANQNVTPTAILLNGQTYVKAVCNQTTSTPGIFPINTVKGSSIPVKPGESYIYKVLGFQSGLGGASLYVKTNSGDLIWPGAVLPQNGVNEDWVSVSFKVPDGVTSIQLGVQWSTPHVGNIIYINRVALYKADFEYNYFIKDQVGSTRVVLQTNPGTQVYTATMESRNQSTESSQFQNMAVSRMVASPGNHTPGGSYAFKMNGAFQVGPAKSIKVYPGDRIDASVYSFFVNTSGYNSTLASIAGTVASTFGGIPGSGEAGSIYQNVTNAYATGGALSGHTGSTSYPSAYLNYILFDKDYNLIPGPGNSGAVPISQTPNSTQQITMPTVTASELGYLYIYLSYENTNTNAGAEVYFDDFKITVQESPVIQVNNFYPFGMQSYTWLRTGETDNAYLFQGKELIAQTGWHDFGSRMYYSDLGRWFATDPQNQFSSPYLAMGNMPMMGRDPNGEEFGIDDAIVFGVGFLEGACSYGFTHNWDDWGNVLNSGIAGGINAEAGYLAMGGGLDKTQQPDGGASSVGALDAAAMTGGRGSLSGAIQFSGLYAATVSTNIAEHADDIRAMSKGGAFEAILGYEAVSAIQAGSQTDWAEDAVDNMIGGRYIRWFDKGVASDAIGGFLSGAIKPTVGKGWGNWDWDEAWAQSAGSASSKFMSNFNDHFLTEEVKKRSPGQAQHFEGLKARRDMLNQIGSNFGFLGWKLILKESTSVAAGTLSVNEVRLYRNSREKPDKYFSDTNWVNFGNSSIKDGLGVFNYWFGN